MNVINYYSDQLINGNHRRNRISFEFKVANYHCSNQEFICDYSEIEDASDLTPLLVMAYDNKQSIAVVNERGVLNLRNIYNLASKGRWHLHKNVIFDIKWRPEVSSQILTASGDLSMILYDIEMEKKKEEIKNSHLNSVRSIDFHDANIFASGSRDGYIKIWDLRDHHEAVVDIPFAHAPDAKALKKKRSIIKSTPTNVVSSVLFDNYYYLYSGGATDGRIKVWDMRKRGTKTYNPVKEIHYPGSDNFSNKHGFACLLMSKGLLYASCSDNSIYCFSPREEKLCYRYKGYRNNNYSRIAILRDEFLISASASNYAYIWKIASEPGADGDIVRKPIYALPETSEVTSVEAVDFNGSIYTGSDEGCLRHWSFVPCIVNEQDDIRNEIQRTIPIEELEKMEKRREKSRVINISIDTQDENTLGIENTSSVRVPSPSPLPTSSVTTTPKLPKAVRKSRTKTKKGDSTKRKKIKIKQAPSTPLTPITNYYRKVPKSSFDESISDEFDISLDSTSKTVQSFAATVITSPRKSENVAREIIEQSNCDNYEDTESTNNQENHKERKVLFDNNNDIDCITSPRKRIKQESVQL